MGKEREGKKEEEEEGGGPRHEGERCKCKIYYFCVRQRWAQKQIKKHRESKEGGGGGRRRERAVGGILRGSNIMSSSHPG